MTTKFKVEIPNEVELSIENNKVKARGPKGELVHEIKEEFIKVERKENLLIVSCEKDIDRQKEIAGTHAALIRNMLKGVTEGYTAELVLIYQHFPPSIKLDGNKLIVENFIGERAPRVIEFPADKVKVNVSNNKITIEGIDKYIVGQVAALFEQSVQPKGKDRRIFKDGLYISKKP